MSVCTGDAELGPIRCLPMIESPSLNEQTPSNRPAERLLEVAAVILPDGAILALSMIHPHLRPF